MKRHEKRHQKRHEKRHEKIQKSDTSSFENVKRKRSLKRILLVIISIILIVILTGVGYFWNRYANKNSLIARFETPEGQTVYLLGTIHKEHFNKYLGYSMEDIVSAIENLDVDSVFIEAREVIYEEYGVVDGPVDMAVAYSYCEEHGISTEMIDWWVVDNDFKSNSTNRKRDDRIFENITRKLEQIPQGKKVLVICGSGHFHEQYSRFVKSGFIAKSIQEKSQIFKSSSSKFEYPVGIEAVWEKRAFFYAYTLPEIVSKDEQLNPEIQAEFTEGNHDAFYIDQTTYCDLFRKNQLFE